MNNNKIHRLPSRWKYIFIFFLWCIFTYGRTNGYTLIQSTIGNAVQYIKQTVFTDSGINSGTRLMDINAASGYIYIDTWSLTNSTGWNNKFLAIDENGYIIYANETNQLFSASVAFGITSTNISNRNNAYSWINAYSWSALYFINHSGNYVLMSMTGGRNSAWSRIQSNSWNALKNYYLTGVSFNSGNNLLTLGVSGYGLVTGYIVFSGINNWNSAYSWIQNNSWNALYFINNSGNYVTMNMTGSRNTAYSRIVNNSGNALYFINNSGDYVLMNMTGNWNTAYSRIQANSWAALANYYLTWASFNSWNNILSLYVSGYGTVTWAINLSWVANRSNAYSRTQNSGATLRGRYINTGLNINSLAVATLPCATGQVVGRNGTGRDCYNLLSWEQWIMGTTGAQWPQGNTGATGATGADGINGTTGSVWATGAQWPQGNTGATWADGINGINGATGATGPTGAMWPTGNSQDSYLTGMFFNSGNNILSLYVSWANTVTWYVIFTGMTNRYSAYSRMQTSWNTLRWWYLNTGININSLAVAILNCTTWQIIGRTGGQRDCLEISWIQWPQWIQGNTGIQWIQWITWAKWETGDIWLTWPKGNTGEQWIQGIQGITGAKWETGDIWLTWPKGNTGEQGIQWITGNDWLPWTNWITGATGPTGAMWPTWFLQAWITGATPFWDGSDWITNSINIFNTWFNIGIGNIIPKAKLDINGNLRIREVPYSWSLTWILVIDASWFVYRNDSSLLIGPQGIQWATWAQWIIWLTWPKWETGEVWPMWPQWTTWANGLNGIDGVDGITWATGPTGAMWPTGNSQDKYLTGMFFDSGNNLLSLYVSGANTVTGYFIFSGMTNRYSAYAWTQTSWNTLRWWYLNTGININSLAVATLNCTTGQVIGRVWWIRNCLDITWSSKWTLSGNNIYNNNYAIGNVWIGTRNPTKKLDVYGIGNPWGTALFTIDEMPEQFIIFDLPNGWSVFEVDGSGRTVTIDKNNIWYKFGFMTSNPQATVDIAWDLMVGHNHTMQIGNTIAWWTGNTITGNNYNGGYGTFQSLSFIWWGWSNTISNQSAISAIVWGSENIITAGSIGWFIWWWRQNTITGSILWFIWWGLRNTIIGTGGNNLIAWGANNKIEKSNNAMIVWGNTWHISGGNASIIVWGYSQWIEESIYSFIWWGNDHSILQNNYSTIVWWTTNEILSLSNYSVIVWGNSNKIIYSGNLSFIWGGGSNIINGYTMTGFTDVESVIVGGGSNIISGTAYGMIGGGINNKILLSNYGTIVWGLNGTINQNSYSFIWGGQVNTIDTTIGDGFNVIAWWDQNTIGINSNQTSIVGWYSNEASGGVDRWFIWWWWDNSIYNSTESLIVWGSTNIISNNSNYSSIVGGRWNIIKSSEYSVIPGGQLNIISWADYSRVGGYKAYALNNYSFVWNTDNTNFHTTKPKTFIVNAEWGVGIYTENPVTWTLHIWWTGIVVFEPQNNKGVTCNITGEVYFAKEISGVPANYLCYCNGNQRLKVADNSGCWPW